MIALLISISELLVEVTDELPVDQGIDILAKLVEDEPVTEAEPAADGRHLERALGELGAGPQ